MKLYKTAYAYLSRGPSRFLILLFLPGHIVQLIVHQEDRSSVCGPMYRSSRVSSSFNWLSVVFKLLNVSFKVIWREYFIKYWWNCIFEILEENLGGRLKEKGKCVPHFDAECWCRSYWWYLEGNRHPGRLYEYLLLGVVGLYGSLTIGCLTHHENDSNI